MTSRTPEGKHVARFIILKKAQGKEKFVRSMSLPGFYLTRAEAETAVNNNQGQFPNVQYKIRQK
jgi:hypothetical protein